MRQLATITTAVLLIATTAYAHIQERFASSDNCKACHHTIVNEWESSLHAKSHFSKNELIEKTIEYMSVHTSLLKEQIVLNCAECHNPRVIQQSVSLEEMYSQAYGQGSGETQAMLDSKFAKDGVSCITCHNVDQIHQGEDQFARGNNLVSWTDSGVMTGPFDDVDSPYHQSEYRDFFTKNSNQLCTVCHQDGESYYGHKTYATGIEYDRSGSDKSCVECHMGEVHERFIVDNELAGTKRPSRSHLFAGVRNSDIVATSITINPTRSDGQLQLELVNETAHRVPTGYGDRVMSVITSFLDSSGDVIHTEVHKLQAIYGDRNGNETISQLAQQTLSDTRLAVNESRMLQYNIPDDATEAKVNLTYRLISKKWAEELGLRSQEYLKTYEIKQRNLKL